MDHEGEQFDMQRLCDLVEAHRAEPPSVIRDRVLSSVHAWLGTAEPADDISILVGRFTG